MNILDVDIRPYIPDILESLIEVWREDVRSIVLERMDSIHYINYVNVEGVKSYVQFLMDCRNKDLSFQFLEKIGFDIQAEKRENLFHSMDPCYLSVIEKFLGCPEVFSPDYTKDLVGIFSFGKETIDEFGFETESEKIEFLNFLRGSEELNTSNYQDFKKISEFSKILKDIEHYLDIYRNLCSQVPNYYENLQEYLEFLKAEDIRKKQIIDSKRYEMYLDLEHQLPVALKELIDRKDSDLEGKFSFFGNLEEKGYIEYFSKKDEEILENLSSDPHEKKVIKYARLSYLNQIDLLDTINFFKVEEIYSKIDWDLMKEYIPPFHVIENMKKKREQKYLESLEDFICCSTSFVQSFLMFHTSTRDYLYEKMSGKEVCVAPGVRSKKIYFPLLFFTVRFNDYGKLDFIYLHEFLHAIEFSYKDGNCISGFDTVGNISCEMNPYRPEKRKYERMNETIVDIMAIRVCQSLHKKGIYFFESKELTDENVNDYNTDHILKEMVTPLLDEYLHEIVWSRLTGNIQILLDRIGCENFEELNDCVNKVDYLLKQGLYSIQHQSDDPLIIEYQQEMERLKGIYHNISCHNSLRGKYGY